MSDPEVSRNSNVTTSTLVPSAKVTIDTTFQAKLIHVYLLGMSIVLGGLTGGWNEGLEAGIWSFFTSLCVVVVGYTMLSCCLAEMTSIVTFSGGAYGYVRSSLGPYFGFMTGGFELLMYNFYTICSVKVLSDSITSVGLSKIWEPLTLFLFYSCVVTFHLRGGIYFWVAMCSLAVISILTILLYIFSEFSQGDKFWTVTLVGEPRVNFVGGPSMLFKVMFKCAWFYVGIETISVAGGRIQNATNIVPKAILWCFGSVLVLSLLVFFTTIMQFQKKGTEDWDLPNVFSPMSLGWHESIGINQRFADLMMIPANFASALGFMYGSMHLLQSMSLSGLMPAFFQPSVGDTKVPVRSLLTCTLLQFVLLVLVNHFSDRQPFYDIAVIGASTIYVALFGSYLVFYYKFSGMKRGFRSPLGPVGAGVGILVFALVFMTIIIYDVVDFYVFIVYISALTLYYYAVVENRQFFSREEQKHFMKAYILNANNKKKKLTPLQRFLATLKSCLFCPSASNPTTKGTRKETANTVARSATAKSKHSLRNNKVADGEESVPSLAVADLADTDKIDDIRMPLSTRSNSAFEPIVGSFRHNSVAPILPPPSSTSTDITNADDDATLVCDHDAHSLSSSSVKGADQASSGKLSSKSRRAVLAWSGKVLNIRESQKFFQLLHGTDMAENEETVSGEHHEEEFGGEGSLGSELATKVAEAFPDQFQAIPFFGGLGAEEEDGEIHFQMVGENSFLSPV